MNTVSTGRKHWEHLELCHVPWLPQFSFLLCVGAVWIPVVLGYAYKQQGFD